MYREHPIICKHCGKDTGMTEEQFMYMVLQEDLKCPHCLKVVIEVQKVEF